MLAFLQELACPSCAIIYLLEFNEYHEVETSICSSGSIAFIAIPGVIADSSRSEIINKLLIYCIMWHDNKKSYNNNNYTLDY